MGRWSVFIDFYSHPKEEDHPLLHEHLLHVANATKETIESTGFGDNAEAGFYAGLLHDIGKLNPIYQDIFTADKSKRDDIQQQYPHKRIHSGISSWLAKTLLDDVLTIRQKNIAIMLMHAHHTKFLVSQDPLAIDEEIQKAVSKNLELFYARHKNDKNFAKLNWDEKPCCSGKVHYPSVKTAGPSDYLRLGFLYSALLQADRGSFARNKKPSAFDLQVNTDALGGRSLSDFRTVFQNEVSHNYDVSIPVCIINAPTGIGKTKAFLDIVKKHGHKFSRVIYFSPLLALTDDIENKIKKGSIVDTDQVLIYNHLYSNIIDQETNTRWTFEHESFNEKFVITTTQRLLMTIYSNGARDKLKLASFKNALLVIDEVQMIPKALLENLTAQLRFMSDYLQTKTILLSATIPHELSDVPKVMLSESTLSTYIKTIPKRVRFAQSPGVSPDDDNFLLMANTRKKAVKHWRLVTEMMGIDASYMSSGLTKKHRHEILTNLKNNKRLVSTQVIEAGVDVSFNKIYREVAPLDSIIQVMGRLNRDNESNDAEIVVFADDGEHSPYSKLEHATALTYLQNATSSYDLYKCLPQYYEKIYACIEKQKDADALKKYTDDLEFDYAWRLVNSYSMDYHKTVVIPESEDWDNTKQILCSKMSRKQRQDIAQISASLPISYNKIRGQFDDELLEQGVLLPKKEELENFYDDTIGLDRWT